jgi:hypothetical protein
MTAFDDAPASARPLGRERVERVERRSVEP